MLQSELLTHHAFLLTYHSVCLERVKRPIGALALRDQLSHPSRTCERTTLSLYQSLEQIYTANLLPTQPLARYPGPHRLRMQVRLQDQLGRQEIHLVQRLRLEQRVRGLGRRRS